MIEYVCQYIIKPSTMSTKQINHIVLNVSLFSKHEIELPPDIGIDALIDVSISEKDGILVSPTSLYKRIDCESALENKISSIYLVDSNGEAVSNSYPDIIGYIIKNYNLFFDNYMNYNILCSCYSY